MPFRNNGLYFFLGLLAASALLVGFMVFPFIVDLVLSGVFAIVLWPMRARLARYMPHRPGLTAGIIAIIALVVVLVPVNIFGIRIILEASSLYTHLAGNTDALQGLFTKITNTLGTSTTFPTQDIGEYAAQALKWLVSKAGSIFSEIASIAFHLVLWFIALYYFLKDGGRIVEYIRDISSLPEADEEKVFNRLESAVRSIVLGSLAIAVLQGFLTGVGLALFGVPNPVLWGFFAIIASLVPGVGSMIVTVPGVLYAFASQDGLFGPIGLLLWGILVVGTADNIVRPFILQRGVNVHPFLVFLSVLGGLSAFGPMGFIIGPLVLSLLFALLDVYPSIMSHS